MATKQEISVSTSTLVKITLFVLALFFLWAIRDIIILLLISIVLASGLEPMVDFLNKKKVPRAVSVLSVYVVAIAVVAFIAYIISPTVLAQFKGLAANKDQLIADFNGKLGGASLLGQLHLGDAISRGLDSFSGQALASGTFFERTIGVFNGFIKIITILVVSFYLVAEKNGMKNFIVPFVPDEYDSKVMGVIRRIQRKIGLWMIAQLIISLIIFALVWIGLTILNVQYALILAIVAGVFELIPYIGPIIFAIPGIFFAFLQNPPLAVVVLLMYIVIQKFEAYVLVPKIMQRTIGVSPLIILVAILIGLTVAGVVGVILAVPIVAALNVILEEYWKSPRELSKKAEVDE